jgi:uncharacterized protein (TIGR02246 family)
MKASNLLVILVAVGVGVSGTTGIAQSVVNPTEVDAIKALMVQTTETFNRHDAKAWAQFCTPDAQLVTVRGESMKGIGEIEKGLATVFEARARRATLKTLDISVRFIRPDVALAHVTNEMSGLLSPEGQTLPSHRELSIRVLVKDQGVWRITAFHNTILQR